MHGPDLHALFDDAFHHGTWEDACFWFPLVQQGKPFGGRIIIERCSPDDDVDLISSWILTDSIE